MKKIKIAFIGDQQSFDNLKKTYMSSVSTVQYVHLDPEGNGLSVLGHEFDGFHVDKSAEPSFHTFNLINRVKSRIR